MKPTQEQVIAWAQIAGMERCDCEPRCHLHTGGMGSLTALVDLAYEAGRKERAMTDRELLELAAKAAGEKFIPWREAYKQFRRGIINHHWNPLTDDGDALRLAVKLGLLVDTHDSIYLQEHSSYASGVTVAFGEIFIAELLDLDAFAATRRAIVRAAAEIGKGMA